MKTLIIIILTILAFSNSKSQLNEQWIMSYNGPGNFADVAVSVKVDDLKNVYVAGSSIGSGTQADFATIKYNNAGSQQWVARYNGTGNGVDIVSEMTTDNQGNVYVTGVTLTAAASNDYATVKYNSNGVQQWVALYNGLGGGIDNSKAIVTDNSGNVYVTGFSYGGPATSYDYATIKYNSSGVQQWAVRYNGPGNNSDEAKSITIDANQNVYVTGQTMGIGTASDFTTVKYNSSGVLQWEVRYNGPGNGIDIAHCVRVDVNENVYVTGYSRGSGNYDYATLKYDQAGNELWVSRYNGVVNANDIPTGMALDNSGNVYITGVTNNDGGGTLSNYATIKYDSSGASQWTAIYNGPSNNNDSATSIILDDSGKVYVTGKSTGVSSSQDFATIQYSSDGIQNYFARYNGSNNLRDVPNDICVDNYGNTYITGSVNGSGSTEDFGTIKYGLISGISTVSSSIPDDFNLEQNYPNPFNPSTNIKYSVPVKGFVTLIIYDIKGNEVGRLVNENQNPGTYSALWDAANLSSGIYYYTLDGGNFRDTKKMILVK
ncbi:MAG: SBBP repeat-containing protein [Ignavibacteria bacterium]|nr:SBBP repeat-containing protein [Ignavibacteria bacterium]